MKLLVATDGSDLALAAAGRGVELLAPPTQITVLVVLPGVPGDDAGGIEGSTETPAEIDAELTTDTQHAQAAIDAVTAALPEPLRAVAKGRIEAGDAGPLIAWVAEQEGSDVVLLGSHGRGAFKRMVMGSVSEHVMRHAPCPVLVVRAASSTPPA